MKNQSFFVSALGFIGLLVTHVSQAGVYQIEGYIYAFAPGPYSEAKVANNFLSYEHSDNVNIIYYSVGRSVARLVGDPVKNLEDFIVGDSLIGSIKSKKITSVEGGSIFATYKTEFKISSFDGEKITKAIYRNKMIYTWSVSCIPALSKISCLDAFNQGADAFSLSSN